jgi:hypothetical protein
VFTGESLWTLQRFYCALRGGLLVVASLQCSALLIGDDVRLDFLD